MQETLNKILEGNVKDDNIPSKAQRMNILQCDVIADALKSPGISCVFPFIPGAGAVDCCLDVH